MKKAQKIAEQQMNTEQESNTPAMDTLAPGSMTGDQTRSGIMSTMMNMMSTMTKSDLLDFFNMSMQQYGPNADLGVPDGAAQANMGSIAAKGAVQEDVDLMFEGKELSEEFKQSVATLIEAAVNSQVNVRMAEIIDEQEQLFDELIEEYKGEMSEQVDEYLSYVVKEWAEENKVGIENSIKVEIQESFMQGLLNLFKEHYVDVPDEKYDLLGDLEKKIQELEDTVNSIQNKNIELASTNEDLNRNIIMADMARDLTVSESAKFFSLAEGLTYTDLNNYAKKLQTIKETYFKAENVIIEDNNEIMGIASLEEEVQQTEPKVEGPMAKYAEAISRTVKK